MEKKKIRPPFLGGLPADSLTSSSPSLSSCVLVPSTHSTFGVRQAVALCGPSSSRKPSRRWVRQAEPSRGAGVRLPIARICSATLMYIARLFAWCGSSPRPLAGLFTHLAIFTAESLRGPDKACG
eukprot:TRINITY_DN10617_c0_g2_i1.p1 TRINITY_DN10617_c0_g2~~TRINITY_DN10617_c0_g2_i1.p1  ORF type:complete len:125 (+),score=4.15 TRINITY_DN10617_c0_g2_i1:666-1040(+)